MKLDITISDGQPDKPAIIFIHGLGMDKRLWTDPSKARVMAGMFPFKLMIRKNNGLQTLYHDLTAIGCTAATWSQSRPVGPAKAGIDELLEVIKLTLVMKNTGLILIGHSRGGLLARVIAMEHSTLLRHKLRALITLSTPHQGTDMARWAVHLSPLASLLKPLVPDSKHGTLAKAARRSIDFMKSTGVRELLAGSDFMRRLDANKPEGAYCLSAGGTNSTLISLPGLNRLQDVLGKLLKFIPEEMSEERGDGLVSAKSAVMPFADEHIDFPVNHAEIVVNPEVRKTIMERIQGAITS
jgi:pimeloyl-ACP methyl ester carboxylesterase